MNDYELIYINPLVISHKSNYKNNVVRSEQSKSYTSLYNFTSLTNIFKHNMLKLLIT